VSSDALAAAKQGKQIVLTVHERPLAPQTASMTEHFTKKDRQFEA
jgi:hypothetical protein